MWFLLSKSLEHTDRGADAIRVDESQHQGRLKYVRLPQCIGPVSISVFSIVSPNKSGNSFIPLSLFLLILLPCVVSVYSWIWSYIGPEIKKTTSNFSFADVLEHGLLELPIFSTLKKYLFAVVNWWEAREIHYVARFLKIWIKIYLHRVKCTP